MNKKGFFSWQGNNLEYTMIGNYIVVTIIILSLATSIIFKKGIITFFSKYNSNKVFFKNINFWLQGLGFFMILMWSSRIVILNIYKYPFYFEHIGFHLCRMHFILISFFLVFRKKEWLRYILYISFVFSIVGLAGDTKATAKELNDVNGIYYQKNIKFYNAGPDTYFYYEYLLTHIFTGIVPVVVSVGIYKKITTTNFYRMILVYIFLSILMFTINTFSDFSKIRGWRSNYWYMGRDRNNNFKDFVGPLTKWPQNILFYSLSGIFIIYTGQFLSLAVAANFKKSKFKIVFKKFISDHKELSFKKIIKFKQLLKS